MKPDELILLGDGPGQAARVKIACGVVTVRFECRGEGGREVFMSVTPPPDLRERLDAVLTEIQRFAFPHEVPMTF